jgi:hypothetical protein
VQVLDALAAAGEGGETVADLRERYRTRYLSLRSAAPSTAQSATMPAATPPQATPRPAPASQPVQPTPLSPAAPAALQPVMPQLSQSVQPVQPVGSVFSWQAFIAEQAIAIMAYLGGFLLLIATLTLEVGRWQGLSDLSKLIAVVLVYLIFGVSGLALRRSATLRTVGRTYLGVFALMTPLVALAVYRYELQGLGMPVAGMVCLAAAYACAVYLALGLRTNFVTYVYLGWVALLVSALALDFWADRSGQWMMPDLALASLVLLVPSLTRRAARPSPTLDMLAAPGWQTAAVSSLVAAGGTLIYGLAYFSSSNALNPIAYNKMQFALDALAVTVLAVGWSFACRRIPALRTQKVWQTLSDALVAVFAALAGIGIAAWAGADSGGIAWTLALLALAEFAAAVAQQRRAPQEYPLRYVLEIIALTLAFAGFVIRAAVADPNWPLLAVLLAGLIVTLGIALIEHARWWTLVSGFCLIYGFHVAYVGVLASLPHPPLSQMPPEQFAMFVKLLVVGHTALALLVWLLALFLGRAGADVALRRYCPPAAIVALAAALYTLVFLPGAQDNLFQAAILGVLALAAFVGSWRINWPLPGGLVSGFFGALAVVPLFIYGAGQDWITAAAIIGPALLALGIRRALGQRWAVAPYSVALWSALVGGLVLTARLFFIHSPAQAGVVAATFLGISFPTWVLLGVVLLIVVAALQERAWWMTTIAGLFAFWAAALPASHLAAFILVIALAVVATALRRFYGRFWNVGLLAGAALASLIVVLDLNTLGDTSIKWQVAALIAFAVVAYALAALAREPAMTYASIFYMLLAVALIQGHHALLVTLLSTLAPVVFALALRLSQRISLVWRIAPYAIAFESSFFTLAHVQPFAAGTIEALLLVFAGLALIATLVERQVWGGVAVVLYAGMAAFAQPDAHALLPLALGLAALGLLVSKLDGPRWALPLYVAAIIATVTTAIQGLAFPGFEAWALLALAVMSYLLAWLEARPEVLPLPLLLAALSLAAAASARHLIGVQTVIAFVALSWLYYGAALLWQRLPGLDGDVLLLWPSAQTPQSASHRVAVRTTGVIIHRWGGVIAASGTALAAMLAPDAFTIRAAGTEAVVLALVGLAGLLAVLTRMPRFHLAWYVAGGLVALALTYQLRWFGADNLQLFILSPGSYFLLVGALLPSDHRLRNPRTAAQLFSLLGALVLMLPSFIQSLQLDPSWLYALILTIESLLITGFGVGTRSRLLVLAGTAFLVLAALRSAVLAVNSGVPVALVIGAVALLLMGLATWLSLRARRAGGVM